MINSGHGPGSVWSSTSRLSNEAELGQQLQAEYQEVVSKNSSLNDALATVNYSLSSLSGPQNN